jgi:Ala-tRNA(Pro) deacylase
MAAAYWIKQMLDARGVPYIERSHPEVFTSQEVAHEEHVSGYRLAKVVVVMADGRPVQLIVPACRRVVLDRVKHLLAAHDVRMASEAEMLEHFPDTEPGAIPPLRHGADVDVLMDASLWIEGDLLFQAGTHRDAIQMRFTDWILLVQPRVEFFTEPASVLNRIVCPH